MWVRVPPAKPFLTALARCSCVIEAYMTVYVGVDVTEQCRVQLPPGYHFRTRREWAIPQVAFSTKPGVVLLFFFIVVHYSLISYYDPLVAELVYATDLKSVV